VVRYWDASAIVPLLASQRRSDAVTAELERDPSLVTWWATRVECASAIARLDREHILGPREITVAYERLTVVGEAWQEVQPASRVRLTAERLLRVHPLKAADALQLAAAIAAADGDPRSLTFVTLDDRLARAAEREGFPVVEPA
jgi:predicted nucleic acid-binding protein